MCEVKVVSNWFSMFGMTILIALHHKNVPFHLIQGELLESYLQKKIPVLLQKNGKAMYGLDSMIQYIDETWPSPPLINPSNTSLHRFWAHFIANKLYVAGSRVILSRIGEAQDGAVKDLVESYKMMEKALAEMGGGVKPFFGGDSIGLVDVVFAPFLCWFHTFETLGGFKLPGEDECPLLCAWVKRVLEVPSVKKVLPNSERMLGLCYFIRKLWLNNMKK